MKTYYSHGKLLLSAEYFVLDGATALAVPTKKGQTLTISPSITPGIHWKSILSDGTLWFETVFDIAQLKAPAYKGDDPIIHTLGGILRAVLKQKPSFFDGTEGLTATAHLEFDRNWGLGSSSTLLTNIASWAQINPYKLLSDTFGGSGYDIACACATGPITYTRTTSEPLVQPVVFRPSFQEQLFFIHLNQKQNSRDSIAQYRGINKPQLKQLLAQVNTYTEKMLHAKTLEAFSVLMETHEAFLSKTLQTPTVKSRLFSTYPGAIKSLGGWGGDFVMVTGNYEAMDYFKKRGFETIIPFKDMVL